MLGEAIKNCKCALHTLLCGGCWKVQGAQGLCRLCACACFGGLSRTRTERLEGPATLRRASVGCARDPIVGADSACAPCHAVGRGLDLLQPGEHSRDGAHLCLNLGWGSTTDLACALRVGVAGDDPQPRPEQQREVRLGQHHAIGAAALAWPVRTSISRRAVLDTIYPRLSPIRPRQSVKLARGWKTR